MASRVPTGLCWLISTLCILGGSCISPVLGQSGSPKAEYWLTDPAKPALFVQQPSLSFTNTTKPEITIQVDGSQTYQPIDGFGYTLTGGSARLIHQMDSSARMALLHELFSTKGKGIGVSYLRVSIGASDLDERVFSYDDLPTGETDPTLAKFSLAPDRDPLDSGAQSNSGHQSHAEDSGVALVAPGLDEDERQLKGRKPEAGILRCLRPVFC